MCGLLYTENNQEIYGKIFGELRPTFLRYRNTYNTGDCDADHITDEMRVSGELQYEAEQKLGCKF